MKDFGLLDYGAIVDRIVPCMCLHLSEHSVNVGQLR